MITEIRTWGALIGFSAVLLLQTGCPLEEDPQSFEACRPGSWTCLSNTRISECTPDSQWGSPEEFICFTGQCQVMDNVPVCM